MMQVPVPRMLLQPLVENAVFHGIAAGPEDEGGLVSLRGRVLKYTFGARTMDAVQIDVIDNGTGIPADALAALNRELRDSETIATRHIGLRNIAQRLALLFPHRYEMTIHSMSGYGTCVTMIFPRVRSRNLFSNKGETIPNENPVSR